MNVFNKIKEKKRTGKIKEVEKPDREFKQLDKKIIEKIEDDITKFDKLQINDKRGTGVSKINNTNNTNGKSSNSQLDRVYLNMNPFQNQPKIINSNKTSTELQVEKHNNNLVLKNNSTGVTSIVGQHKDNKGEIVTSKYDVKRVSGNTQTANWEQVGMTGKEKDFFVETVTNNKLTWGTHQMMNNEVLHAHEAIESGIYISWESRDVIIVLII